MNFKKMGSVALSAAMAASLVACGGGSSSGSSSSDGTIKVNIWDNNQKDGLQKIADKWTETSGVPVKIEVVDWDNYWTLLSAGAQGGEMPDVFWMHSNEAQRYMENGLLLDLNSYIEKDGIDMSVYYEGVANLYKSNGVQYALPKDHDTIALLYNKAIFDKYGVECPTDDWSWDDVLKAATAITQGSNGDVYGFAMNTTNNQDGWYNLVEGYGGKIITDDHKGTTIGSKEGKAGMEMMRKILEVATPQSVVSETGTDSLFMSGKTAMITQGSWMINAFYTAENHADYFWAEMPYADANGNGKEDEGERVSAYNGLGWAANAKVANPDACASLIEFFCSEEGQKMQAELGVTMGGMKGVSEAFASAFEGLDVSAFVKVEESGKLFFRPYTRNTVAWENPIEDDFLPAWQNPSDKDVMAKACEKAQATIENAIANE